MKNIIITNAIDAAEKLLEKKNLSAGLKPILEEALTVLNCPANSDTPLSNEIDELFEKYFKRTSNVETEKLDTNELLSHISLLQVLAGLREHYQQGCNKWEYEFGTEHSEN